MKQGNIFEVMFPALPNNKPIKLIESFAGYGSQALALKYLGVDFESLKVVEFDKKVVKAYNEMHESDFPAIDIRDVKELECDHHYLNICTYSFPCQDLSKAGKGKGMTKGDNTRSGLLWEVERILLNTQNKPQVLLMENVPDVIGSKNIDDFKLWIEQLEQMGYSNYVECLNAKNYGIPQNRNRAFMVSIMGEYSYTFPSKMKLKYRLKDMLEIEVDDKYYLSEKMIKGMQNTKFESYKLENKLQDIEGVVNTIIKRYDGSPMCINSKIIPEATKQGYAIANDGDGVYINRPHQKRGVVQKGMIQTIMANGNDVGVVENMRIRKLTPKECFRLMGVKDSDSNRLTCSNSQKYALAGNSIVTTVLMALFGELLQISWKSKVEKLIEELKEQQENGKN